MFGLIKKYMVGYRAISIVAPVFKFIEAVLEIFIPLLVAAIIDRGIGGGDMGFVWRVGGLMLIFYCVGFVLALACQYLAAKSAFGFGTNLRLALFSRINSLSVLQSDRLTHSTLINNINIDVSAIQNTINRTLRLATRAPFILIGALIMSLRLNLLIGLIIFAVAALIFGILFFVLKKSKPVLKKINAHLDKIALQTRENLTGARVIRSSNAVARQDKKFGTEAKKIREQSVLLHLYTALSSPLALLAVNLVIMGILYFGGLRVRGGDLTQGQVVALVNYMLQILNAVSIVAMLSVLFVKAAASGKRINAVFGLSLDEKDLGKNGDESEGEGVETNGNADEIKGKNGQNVIEFKSVCLKYGDGGGFALKDISFCLKNGQSLGVVGATGSGKSSLLNLIAGFFDYSGSILFLGQELRGIGQGELSNLLGYSMQGAEIFEGSILENVDMGRGLSHEQVFKALAAAGCDFANELDFKLMGDGANLSGGQKQRLMIARAILGIENKKLLMLDDSFSALDFDTKMALKGNLDLIKCVSDCQNFFVPIVKIVATNSVSLIKDFDLILVLDKGKIVSIGTHSDLLSCCKIYKQIVQFSD